MANEFWIVSRITVWYDILENGEREVTDVLSWGAMNHDKIYSTKELAFADCWALCEAEFNRVYDDTRKQKLYGYVPEFEKNEKYCICRKVYNDNTYGSEDRFFIQKFEV